MRPPALTIGNIEPVPQGGSLVSLNTLFHDLRQRLIYGIVYYLNRSRGWHFAENTCSVEYHVRSFFFLNRAWLTYHVSRIDNPNTFSVDLKKVDAKVLISLLRLSLPPYTVALVDLSHQ